MNNASPPHPLPRLRQPPPLLHLSPPCASHRHGSASATPHLAQCSLHASLGRRRASVAPKLPAHLPPSPCFLISTREPGAARWVTHPRPLSCLPPLLHSLPCMHKLGPREGQQMVRASTGHGSIVQPKWTEQTNGGSHPQVSINGAHGGPVYGMHPFPLPRAMSAPQYNYLALMGTSG